ncbi:unnamed protein product [Psylliodes chrysocephalus]|uniref:Uncharacterized protein n=1 Tax=Psylliodes chrysocephalus TaxID=3402493 RepID=A0A9P0CUV7_9CUCU|nr:unnamed protein product [Psylliodes chrysocephala]
MIKKIKDCKSLVQKYVSAAYQAYYKTVFGDLPTEDQPEDDQPEMSNENDGYKSSEQFLTDEQKALLNEDTRLRRSTAKSALSETPIPELELPSTSQSTSFHSSPEQSVSSFSNDLKRFASDLEDPYPENHKKPKKIDVINPAVVSALDRTNTSSRSALNILAAFSLGVPVEDTNLSYTTIRRRRLEATKDIVDDLKDKIQFSNNVFLHWDTKFLVDVCGYDKVYRLAVVFGSNFEQLVNISKIESGTGEQQSFTLLEQLIMRDGCPRPSIASKCTWFQNQFNVGSKKDLLRLGDVCSFISIVYVKALFEATSPIKAPVQDLNFLKNLINCKNTNEKISNATVLTFSRHLWYLIKRLATMSFFDSSISLEMKKKMINATKKDGNKVDENKITLT